MNRALELKVIILTAIAVIPGLIALPQCCFAQQASPTAAITGKVIELTSAAPTAPPEPTAPAGTSQGAASRAGRVRTFTCYVPLRESRTTVNLGTKCFTSQFRAGFERRTPTARAPWQGQQAAFSLVAN